MVSNIRAHLSGETGVVRDAPPKAGKAELRAWALEQRRIRGTGDSVGHCMEGAGMLSGLREYADAKTVAGYLSLPGERSVEGILAAACAVGKRAVVPVWNATERHYDLCRWEPDMPVAPGYFKVREPVEKIWIDPGEVDFVLVPGVVFGRNGGRIGFGGGHYDRLLPRCRSGAFYVGIAFNWQLVDEVRCEPHDIRMHAVLSETGLYSVCPLILKM